MPPTGPVVVLVHTQAAAPAVLWAAEECSRRGTELHLVTFGAAGSDREADGASVLLQQVSAAAAEHAPGVRIVTRAAPGPAAAGLIAASGQAGQIVIAADGLTGDWSAPDSTAWTVAAHSKCPVIIWRPTQNVALSAPVVVGLDGSTVSTGALEFALLQASWRRVPLVTVLAWSDVFLDADAQMLNVLTNWQKVVEDYRRLLAQQLAGAQEQFPDVQIERVLTRDRPVRALLKEAATAQLLVVGSHGRGGFQGMLLGSVSRALIDYSPCPLAVVRPADAGPPQ